MGHGKWRGRWEYGALVVVRLGLEVVRIANVVVDVTVMAGNNEAEEYIAVARRMDLLAGVRYILILDEFLTGNRLVRHEWLSLP